MSVYWTLLWLAWVAAATAFFTRGRHSGVAKMVLVDGILLSLPLTVLGTHVLFALLNPGQWADWGSFFASGAGWRSGHTSFGAIAGVLVALSLVSRAHRVPLPMLIDCAGPSLFIASPIVRLGCFFGGCCYGGATQVAWAVRFPASNPFAPVTPPSHPTQLYEAAASVVVLLSLPTLFGWIRVTPGRGRIAIVCLLLYFVERFLLEFFRLGAAARAVFVGLSFTHFLALGGALICFLFIWKWRFQPDSRRGVSNVSLMDEACSSADDLTSGPTGPIRGS